MNQDPPAPAARAASLASLPSLIGFSMLVAAPAVASCDSTPITPLGFARTSWLDLVDGSRLLALSIVSPYALCAVVALVLLLALVAGPRPILRAAAAIAILGEMATQVGALSRLSEEPTDWWILAVMVAGSTGGLLAAALVAWLRGWRGLAAASAGAGWLAVTSVPFIVIIPSNLVTGLTGAILWGGWAMVAALALQAFAMPFTAAVVGTLRAADRDVDTRAT